MAENDSVLKSLIFVNAKNESVRDSNRARTRRLRVSHSTIVVTQTIRYWDSNTEPEG